MGRASLIMILGASITVGVMNIQLNRASEQATENLVRYFDGALSRSLANEAASYVLGMYADSATLRVNYPAELPSSIFSEVGDHTLTYSLYDTTITVGEGDVDVVKLVLQAEYGKSTHDVVVYAGKTLGFVPDALRGAITTNGVLDKAVGDLQIDGRNHTESGSLEDVGGVYGISTGFPFKNVGNASIGGTGSDGTNYSVGSPHNPACIEQNYNWSAGFPNDPDGVFGFPGGSLKEVALSGRGGSQYVTDPKDLTFPLRGVTYVELPEGVSWKFAWLGENPSGIIVVHNASNTARMENIASKTPFKGMIVADYMFHIHLDVIGGIVLLSNKQEKIKTCKDNHDKKILFSREAIQRATYMTSEKGTGWRNRVPIFGWKE
ncbi:MAG: hypothetical protein L0Y80_05520 [Ignavibacteriae bacterium]|nr:hypothetical protein [Ignavibacteriota bacterium]